MPRPAQSGPGDVASPPPEDGRVRGAKAESWASSEAVRRSMTANRSRDTRPELAVRRLLHRHGLRYRVCRRPLPGLRATADIVFTRQRVAVFIDGCFWHACRDHFRAPVANADYWRAKIDRNRARDEAVNQSLGEAGWTVLRFWSHEDPAAVAARVEAAVRGGAPPAAEGDG